MREAPSLLLIEQLLAANCKVRVFDPISMAEAKKSINHLGLDKKENIYYATDIYDAVLDADALFLVTEWKEFRLPSWAVIKKTMRGNLILDGRNIYDKSELIENGFVYEGIGL
jgi:UDPglucose 6-dehydrogenase